MDGISAIEGGKQESVACGCGFTVSEMIRESCPGGCLSIGRGLWDLEVRWILREFMASRENSESKCPEVISLV